MKSRSVSECVSYSVHVVVDYLSKQDNSYLSHPGADNVPHVGLEFGLKALEIGRRNGVLFLRYKEVSKDSFIV